MGRHARLIVPGVALHVRHRGNNGQVTFRHDNDRLVYLSLLRDGLRHRQCGLHAYCLMNNHVHLLLTPADEGSCALLMRDLGRGYAAYFNRRHGMWGALWERPFRSCLVDSAEYVIACHRYIERNPVRAQMVTSPHAHPWSSFAGNAGLRGDDLLTAHPEYLALGLDSGTRSRAYEQLVTESDDPQLLATMREATDCGLALVGERLRAELENAGARLEHGKRGPRTQAGGSADEAAQLALLTE
jgi:REP-associated tyrosine transposase